MIQCIEKYIHVNSTIINNTIFLFKYRYFRSIINPSEYNYKTKVYKYFYIFFKNQKKLMVVNVITLKKEKK